MDQKKVKKAPDRVIENLSSEQDRSLVLYIAAGKAQITHRDLEAVCRVIADLVDRERWEWE